MSLPSEKFGSMVAAAITLTPAAKAAIERGEAKKFGFMAVRNALEGKIAKYKIPKKVKVVDVIPRNAMGKSKFVLVCFFFFLFSVKELFFWSLC